MTYVGVKCLTRHYSVLRDTLTRGTTCRENHGEDSISHLLTSTQLAEESNALTRTFHNICKNLI